MRTIPRSILILTILLAASSGPLALHGQEAHLAEWISISNNADTPAPADPISDDGDDLSALHPASQLLITFTGTSAGPVSILVFNETGELVLYRSVPTRPGRQFLPIDVDGLASGRYLVRVQEGAAVSSSRFLRP